MVESSAGACRCACQGEEEAPSTCCSPHVFTSALLGALACVLMTGGVFLAFHRWDPLWLIVSAVGVVLVLIGSLLHCCGAREARAARRAALGNKGCCGRGMPLPDAHHVINNGGSLTEQLLPLSNARSVSQLSLNMLPGYFPPVVTTYGIEQHSAVVQNINRLVQQQQQQQQQPSSPGSVTPSVANGKSFILFSLPGDTPQANIQNLVATVYQLDGNVVTEIPATDGVVPTLVPPVTVATTTPIPLVLKNAEVQTCNVWPVPSTNCSNAPMAVVASTSTSSGTTVHDLMDCSTICDTTTPDIPVLPPTNVLVPVRSDITPETSTTDVTGLSKPRVSIPGGTSGLDVVSGPSRAELSEPDVSGTSVPGLDTPGPSNVSVTSIPEPSNVPVISIPGPSNVSVTSIPEPSNVSVSSIPEPPSVSVTAIPGPSRLDTPGPSKPDGTGTSVPGPSILDTAGPTRIDPVLEQPSILLDLPTAPPGGDFLVEIPDSNPSSEVLIDISEEDCAPSGGVLLEGSCNGASPGAAMDESLLGAVGGASSSLENLSDIEMDEGELMERSSPPPSYDDVTHEGLGYGTI